MDIDKLLEDEETVSGADSPKGKETVSRTAEKIEKQS